MFQPSNAVVVTAIAGSGGASALVDLWSRRVPNKLTLGVAVLGVTLAALGLSGLSLTAALGGLVVGLLVMLPGHVIGATGAGDVKLFGASGALLGPAAIVAAFIYTAIAGGVLALVVALRRGRLQRTLGSAARLVTGAAKAADLEAATENNRFPFAPAIAVGAIVAAIGL